MNNMIREALEKIDLAKKTYDDLIQAAVQPGLEQIARDFNGQVELILIVGYTPSFNDGEPCEHSTNVLINAPELDSYGYKQELESLFEDHEFDYSLKSSNDRDLNEFCQKVLVESFDRKHGTNYIVGILFKDGQYTIREDEYECGY